MSGPLTENVIRSQDDLARLAGVTRMTVHRALSGHPTVAARTKRRIEELARQMGYRPNAAARTMKSGQFNAIGILRHTAPRPGWLSFGALSEIEQAAVRHDLHLVSSLLADDTMLKAPRAMPRLLRELMVDGLLVVHNGAIAHEIGESIRNSRVPLIWLNLKEEADCIHPDDFGAGRDGAEHLLRLGHKRVMYLGDRSGSHYSDTDRYGGYVQALSEAGLAPMQHSWDPQANNWQVAHDILAGSERPTAILTPFEPTELILAARMLGLRLPQDLSILVIRDPSFVHVWAQSRWIGGMELTTLEIPVHAMGREAVELLIRKINAPAVPIPARSLPCVLQPGESCAPPGSPSPH